MTRKKSTNGGIDRLVPFSAPIPSDGLACVAKRTGAVAGAAITSEQGQALDSQFDRAGTIEDYFAQPRSPSLVERLAESKKEIGLLNQKLAVIKFRERQESDLAAIIVKVIGRIIEISQRLFPGPVTFDYSFDPEDPSDEYLVFDVTAKGEVADYCDREYEWHEEVEKVVPGALCEFRLCVMPQR